MKKLKPIHGLVIFISLYASLGLLNLQFLPVAWNDEVQNLDPAIQYLHSGTFKSIIWPNPGADKLFASYPPLLQYFHTAWLRICPVDIFFVRLPFLILTFFTFILLYSTLNRSKNLKNSWLPLIILMVFALDKSTFELSRSVRVEPLILFLLSLYLYIQPKHWPILKFTIIGISATAHFYIWPILIVWFIYEWLQLTSINQKILLPIISALPWLLYFYSIDFQFDTWISQMSMQTADHQITSTDLPHSAFANSFFFRFWPHYREQPLNIILFLSIIILTLTFSFKKRTLFQPRYQNLLALLLFIILLFAFASPQYRYLPPLLLISLITLSNLPWLNFNTPKIKYFLLIISLNGFFSFGGRHLASQLQKPQRDPIPVYNFLSKHLSVTTSTQKSLLIGDAIGAYYTYHLQTSSHQKQHHSLDYAFDYYPIDWQPYQKVFILTHDSLPSYGAHFIAQYTLPNNHSIPKWALTFAKGQTYKGMNLYQLK